MNAKYEIEKIIRNQKTVSTDRLKVLFQMYEKNIREKNRRKNKRMRKLERRLTNQRRELANLKGRR